MKHLIFFFVLVTSLLLSSCSGSNCKVEDVNAAIDQLEAKHTKFANAVSLAEVTARIALTGPVSDMQTARRETDGIVVPECLSQAKTDLLGYMDETINGFLAFIGKEDDTSVMNRMQLAANWANLYDEEVARVKACAPRCDK